MGNYLGRGIDDITTANITVDKMEGDNAPNGVRNTLTISQRNIPSSINNITVYIDGIQQRAETDFTLSNSTITFATAPTTGQNVVAVTKGDATLSFISDSTVVAESYADGAITNDKLVSFDASKLTGAFDAIDGGALTGITEVTVISSDPTITTNPDNVGDIYVNSTTGEMFSCIDKTTDENSWVNVGGGSEHVLDKPFGGRGGGTVAAFSAAGYTPGATQFHINTVDKFSIPNPSGTATDHADLTNGQTAACSSCSATDGYSVAGQVKGYGSNPPDNSFWTKIQKYNFSSANTVSQPGDISTGGFGSAGHSSYKEGYASGGVGSSFGNLSRIEKFLFSNESTVSNVGNLTIARRLSNCGHSTNQRGYTATGESPTADHIERFSFVNEAETTDWGDLTQARYSSASMSSETHGYVAGGNGSQLFDTIDRFSFLSGSGASDVGNLSEQKASSAGQSGETQGYISGAYQHSGAGLAVIESFTYSSSTNSSNVASLFEGRGYCTGTQY